MTKYLVIWTYIANYGRMHVTADSPESAAALVVKSFCNPEFTNRATIYVCPAESITIIGAQSQNTIYYLNPPAPQGWTSIDTSTD